MPTLTLAILPVVLSLSRYLVSSTTIAVTFSLLLCPVRAPGHNAPLIRFLILVLYVYLFMSYASPLIFLSLFPYLSPPLLIFFFENTPAEFPGRMS